MGDPPSSSERIQVAIRCRPLNSKELARSSTSCVDLSTENDQCVALLTEDGRRDREARHHRFVFDQTYGPQSTNSEVYDALGAPTLESALQGFNATIFAYGQTGSGKTHTMSGSPGDPGLIPRLIGALFDRIASEKDADTEKKFLVVCSFFEIYNEVIFDLLDGKGGAQRKGQKGGLQIKEHPVLGVHVKGLQSIVVDSAAKTTQLLKQGNAQRSSGATNMNEHSSRSHSIFMITVHQKHQRKGGAAGGSNGSKGKSVFAKINLVDLAGSERAARTGASGARLKEGANINKSLSALGNVINALSGMAAAGGSGTKKVFVPYRNSKLTRVLQESLGGNSLCSMLAAISPASDSAAETRSTLQYADRAKSIQLHAKKNEEADVIERLKEELANLKEKLSGGGGSGGAMAEEERRRLADEHEAQINDLNAMIQQTWEDKAALSRQHEEERQRALAEQEAERRKLHDRVKDERRRQLELLRGKKDAELTLRDLRARIEGAGLVDKAEEHRVQRWLAQLARVRERWAQARKQRAVAQFWFGALEEMMSATLVYRGGAAAPPSSTLGAEARGAEEARSQLVALEKELRKLLRLELAPLREAGRA